MNPAQNPGKQDISLLICALENLYEAAFLAEKDSRFLFVNDEACRLLGYTREELLEMKVPLIDLDLPASDWSEHWIALKKKRSLVLEGRHKAKHGHIVPVEIHANYFEYNGEEYNLALVRNIADRHAAQQALQEKEKHSQSLLRLSRESQLAQTYGDLLQTAAREVEAVLGYKNIWVYLFGEDGEHARALMANGSATESILSDEAVVTLTIKGDRMLEEIAQANDIVVVEDARTDPRTDKEIVSKLGNRTIVNVPVFFFERRIGAVGMGTFGEEGIRIPTPSEQDYLRALASHLAVSLDRLHLYNERIKSEEALRRINRELHAISNCNQTLLRAEDESSLLNEICRIICEEAGYLMAWVGFAQQNPEKTVRPIAWAGKEKEYINNLNVSWAEDTPLGRGPAGQSIRTGEIIQVQDFAKEPRMAPWRERLFAHGFRSETALPLKDENGTVFGVLTIYSGDKNAFNQGEVRLLQELAGDLAFGITSLRIRNQKREYFEKLERSMEKTVTSIAATLEIRDPYTAGHQRRVAQLAAAMAQEMGLDTESIKGIFIASMIHDIGKISIPSEILNRPGRMTKTELELIRTHPEAGYSIIKDIEFPWPVALMVLQHHERMDGSGYPNGLRGDQIIPGARIIAVADVIESMATHRPYRPALGMEVALGEIETKTGTLYDAKCVQACLTLFRSRGFVLPTVEAVAFSERMDK